MHTRVSGLVDEAFNTDEECLDALKRYLSFMPSHCEETPPVARVPKGSDDPVDGIFGNCPRRSQEGLQYETCDRGVSRQKYCI